MKTYTASEIKELIKDIPDDKWAKGDIINRKDCCCLVGNIELKSGTPIEEVRKMNHDYKMFTTNIKELLEKFYKEVFGFEFDFYIVNDNNIPYQKNAKGVPELKAISENSNIKQRNLMLLDLMISKGY